jgi:hypothetical protein
LPFKDLTLARAECAKTVMHLMKDKRSRKAVKVAKKFGLGKATLRELRKAADNAIFAYEDAHYAAIYDDTIIAYAYASYAAYDSVDDYFIDYDKYYAPRVVGYAYDAVYYHAIACGNSEAEAKAASIENRKLTANICRKVLGDLIIKKINEII